MTNKMVKIVYTGTLPNVRLQFADGTDKKISSGDVIDVSELDWERMSLTGNFELESKAKVNKVKSKED